MIISRTSFVLKKRLVIELDGKSHEETAEHDKLRDDLLSKLGFRTVPFTNEELFEDIENVLTKIRNCLNG